jgi:hypothetical protein
MSQPASESVTTARPRSASLNLSPPRNPVRLVLSRDLWSAAWHLFAAQFTGAVMLTIALGAALTGAVASLTIAGLPVLAGAAGVIRWCANTERRRLRPLCGETGSAYRADPASGLLSRVQARWTDPALWRDIGYLIGLYLPLAVLDLTVLTVWLTLLAGITLPAWYWAPWETVHGVRFHGYQLGYFPNGPHGHPGYGLYISTLPEALATAAVCLVGFAAFSYVLLATARAHAAVARGLLEPPQDPLHEAKEVLRGRGPLAAAGQPRLGPNP